MFTNILKNKLNIVRNQKAQTQLNISNLENMIEQLDNERKVYQNLVGMEKLLIDLIQSEEMRLKEEPIPQND